MFYSTKQPLKEELAHLKEPVLRVYLTDKGAKALEDLALQVETVSAMLGIPVLKGAPYREGNLFSAPASLMQELRVSYGEDLWKTNIYPVQHLE